MTRQVEVFTANCPVCDPVVQMVQELACDQCEVIIHDIVKQGKDKPFLNKLAEYGVNCLPSVAVNGKLCCRNKAITRNDLVKAGIGER
ncbi:MAG: thioredoxin family protein [Flavobacteriaceae bacterium]|nr:thioredoxin family protein [Flavobacteriaceae bacterium]